MYFMYVKIRPVKSMLSYLLFQYMYTNGRAGKDEVAEKRSFIMFTLQGYRFSAEPLISAFFESIQKSL